MQAGSTHGTLVDVDTLREHLDDPGWVVVDARFNLMDPAWGRGAYLESHVPGAVFADVDEDLSGPPVTDRGRHPMPTPEALVALFSRLGIAAGTQVVTYDQGPGVYAARTWWLLRYMGHDAVAALDGGFAAWTAADAPTRSGEEVREAARFRGSARRDWLVTVDGVPGARRLVDSREADRYRGEREPLDPVAGHIPGAVNHYYGNNLSPDGGFLPPEELASRLGAALGDCPAEEAVFYCGSGVSACHNLLALAHAGLPPARLYAGSWSEWCADGTRPVATGEEA